MPTFIKAGFWEKRTQPAQGYKGELNLDQLYKQLSGEKILRGLVTQVDNNPPQFTQFKNTLGVNIVDFTTVESGIYLMVFDTNIFQSPFEDVTLVGSAATSFATFTAVPSSPNSLLIESGQYGAFTPDVLGLDGPCVLQIVKYN